MSLPFSQLIFQSDLLVEDGAFESIDTSGMEAQPLTASLQHLEADPLLLHPSDDLMAQPTSSHFEWLQNSGPFMSGDAFDDHRYGPSDTDYDRLVNATHDYYDKVPQTDFDNERAEHSYAYFLPPAASAAYASASHHNDAYSTTVAAAAADAEPLLAEAASCSSSSNSSTSSSSPPTVARRKKPTTVPRDIVPSNKPDHVPTTEAHEREEMACEWRSEDGVKCTWRGARCSVEAHVSAEHVGRGIMRPLCRWDGCNKSFVRRYLLLRHIRCVHCEDKPFACGECGQRFSLRERMKLHQRVAHGQHLQLKLPKNWESKYKGVGQDEQQQQLLPTIGFILPPPPEYACGQCMLTFPTTAHRRHHVERIHENARFACEYCNDLFADRSSLARHKRKKHTRGRKVEESDEEDTVDIKEDIVFNSYLPI